MKKTYKPILICFILFFIMIFLCGCWDSNDINEKIIATAVIVDLKDDQFYFYMEYANIQGGTADDKSTNPGTKYKYIIGKGKTILEARENLNSQLHKAIYLSGVRSLILTENFAKEHLLAYLYRLRSDTNYRQKTITVITKEDPEKLLDINNEHDISVGFEAEEILLALEESGSAFHRTTSRLLENLSSEFTGVLIPCMGLQEEQIALCGYSLVCVDRVTDFIPLEKSMGIVFLKEEKAKSTYNVTYKDIEYTIEASLKKSKIESSFEDGQMAFKVNMEFKGELKYGSKKIPYNLEDEDMKKISELLKEKLNEDITSAIDESQQVYKCDYFQFDDEFRVKYPNEFKEMDWEKEYPKAKIEINLKANVKVSNMMDYGTYEID